MKRRENKYNFLYFGIAIVAITFLFILFFYEKPSKFCKNELFVISSDSLPKFNLKLNQLKDSLTKDVERFFYESDICDKDINFGLILSNKDVVNVHVMKDCNPVPKFYSNMFTLYMNEKGIIFFDYDYFPIDSIPNKILENFVSDFDKYEKQYSPYKNLRDKFIYVDWRLLTPKDSIEKVLLKTQEGFVKIYDEIASKRFNKSLCKMDIIELYELKNEFKCNLVLDFYPIPLPPPPPPPPIIN